MQGQRSGAAMEGSGQSEECKWGWFVPKDYLIT